VYIDPTGHFKEKELIDWFGDKWRDLFSESMVDILLHADFGDMVVYGKDDEGNLLAAIFAQDDKGNLVMWDLNNKIQASASNIDSKFQDGLVSLYKLVYSNDDRRYEKDREIVTMSEDLPEGLYLPNDNYDVGDEQYLSSNLIITGYNINFLSAFGTAAGIVAFAIEGGGPWGVGSFVIGLASGIEWGRSYHIYTYSPYAVPTPPIGPVVPTETPMP
jgi:hypothetical protein